MTFTTDQLMWLRDNLDGLGYHMGPRGLFGIGNELNAFDAAALGGGSITANHSMRSITQMDAYTRAAIFQFQRDRNLPANGQFGPDLEKRIDAAVKDLQNNLKIVLAADPKVNPALKAEVDPKSTLDPKKKLQITGYYGVQTFKLVKEYQRIRGLSITGTATSAVQRQLRDDALRITKPPSPTPTPTPTPSPTSDAQTRLTRLADIKRRYQSGDILTDDFVREVIQAIP